MVYGPLGPKKKMCVCVPADQCLMFRIDSIKEVTQKAVLFFK